MRIAVVTGAGAGLGRAIARRFARAGLDVALIARSVERLEAAAAEVASAGRRALVLPLDVADACAVDEAAERVERELGPIDVWVNNAMTSVFSPVVEMTADEYRRVTEVNYLGYVHGTLSALRRMRPRDRGVIVQVGSALGYRAIPLQSAYCATKHAIVGFTDSLRCELLHERSNVALTMVEMPALNTPQFGWVRSRLARKAQPVPPIYQPEVGAEAVYWAAVHRPRTLPVGWSTLLAIWAQKLAAGLVDRYLAATAFDAQQHDGAEDPSRPDDLERPVAGASIAARGGFDDRAKESTSELWFATHVPLVTTALLAALVLWRRVR